jgi:hypothetical protein
MPTAAPAAARDWCAPAIEAAAALAGMKFVKVTISEGG